MGPPPTTFLRLLAFAILVVGWLGCDANGLENEISVGSDASIVSPQTLEQAAACPKGAPIRAHPPIYGYVDYSPAWHPDGNQIVFLRDQPVRGQLRSLDLVSGKQEVLTDGVLQVTWFPSGDSLLATMTDYNLYVLNPDGSIRRALTSEGSNWFADVSPDGRYLAWDRNFRDIWMSDLDADSTWLLDNGGDPAAWRTGSWSPDGQAYVHLRYGDHVPSGFESIYVSGRNGPEGKRLTYRATRHEDPQWSPLSGRYIAYVSKGCPWLLDVFIYDYTTGRHTRLSGEGGLNPEWSPNEEMIVYVKHNPFLDPIHDQSQGYLHVLDLSTGLTRRISFP